MIDVTEDLKQWCNSEAQTRAIDAILANAGSVRAAARSLGVHHKTLQSTLKRVQEKASRGGYAPGHFVSGVAPGYAMGKVTVQRDKNGIVERTWERQSPEDQAREEAFAAALQAMKEELPALPRSPAPLHFGDEKLLNLFPITDYHMGMLAWDKETGDDWDITIAERLLYQSFERMLTNAPHAKTAVLAQLGDFLHFDGLKAVTPQHGHLLDADSRFPKLVSAVIRVLRRVVGLALETHDEVHVIMAEGNHDMVSSIWLRAMFAELYRDDPRVTVDTTPYPYYAYVFGKTLLGFHHGHLAKNGSLPGLFAAKFRAEWGQTIRSYIYTGHRHHEETKEFPGAKVFQLPTMAAADAYAARGGWLSERQMSRITFHIDHGKIGEEVIIPDMFAVA